MYRNVIEDLKKWKESEYRKPLVLAGARQVGKTYILRKFGEEEFDNVAYINCDDNEMAKDLFTQDYDMQRIILAIGALTRQEIVPGRTLIILDEIQEVKRGLSALKFYVDIASFKLFLLDCGLFGAMSETAPEALLVAENGMEEAKGAFTENYVMCQLVATQRNSVFYHTTDAKLEIDFLIQHGTDIIPIEAKAEENLRSKSLSTFVAAHPQLHGLRFSMSDYREQDWMTNVPLYAVSTLWTQDEC